MGWVTQTGGGKKEKKKKHLIRPGVTGPDLGHPDFDTRTYLHDYKKLISHHKTTATVPPSW